MLGRPSVDFSGKTSFGSEISYFLALNEYLVQPGPARAMGLVFNGELSTFVTSRVEVV